VHVNISSHILLYRRFHESRTYTRWTAVGALHDSSLARVVEQWALGERDVCSYSCDCYSTHTHNVMQKRPTKQTKTISDITEKCVMLLETFYTY